MRRARINERLMRWADGDGYSDGDSPRHDERIGLAGYERILGGAETIVKDVVVRNFLEVLMIV